MGEARAAHADGIRVLWTAGDFWCVEPEDWLGFALSTEGARVECIRFVGATRGDVAGATAQLRSRAGGGWRTEESYWVTFEWDTEDVLTEDAVLFLMIYSELRKHSNEILTSNNAKCTEAFVEDRDVA